jgi:3-oxoacyl-[acyl-carrier protein] reductase
MSAKVALVTGGSRGIGRAIARRLALNGWKVAVHYGHDRSEAEQCHEELGAASAGIFQADLALPDSAKNLFAAVEKITQFDALVNNAGVYMPMNFLKAGDVEFEATMRKTFTVNFENPLRLARLAANGFVKTGRGGKIVNVCSRVGFKGESGAALYAASKAALINVTRSLAGELAPSNIQTFGIAPGWVDTAMARAGMEDRLPTILRDIPLGRMASPEDCAAVVAFLLSDQASYISGNVIDINGASYFH